MKPSKHIIPELLVVILGVATLCLCFYYLKREDEVFKDLTGIIRVVVALATSAVSISLPGFINLETFKASQTDTLWPKIKAGGALAVFVIVYLFNPINF